MSMPDSNAKKRWDKDNRIVVTFKLFRETSRSRNDQEIIDFLQGKTKAEVVKNALREYMQNHPEQ